MRQMNKQTPYKSFKYDKNVSAYIQINKAEISGKVTLWSSADSFKIFKKFYLFLSSVNIY